ncbi:hypothetical protein HELRODRAFT_160467 [Helobdella robusta]|uniref:Uncharacterized protein n=1 Tax=Helobdella robusta TaxID=6412 RepID=T1EQA3_HELRO|nr:hypothetical protein HELRODRAFT_160467 [Helobdella robusta]ESO06303.1 hypothetical protein HELRODRAFT_160467 [Helobdella robusta]
MQTCFYIQTCHSTTPHDKVHLIQDHVDLRHLPYVSHVCTEVWYIPTPFQPQHLKAASPNFSVLTRDQTIIAAREETIVLECSFHVQQLNLFVNPLIWVKRQLNEEVKINIMRKLKEPFAGTKRFLSTMRSDPPKHTFRLTILKPRNSATNIRTASYET